MIRFADRARPAPKPAPIASRMVASAEWPRQQDTARLFLRSKPDPRGRQDMLAAWWRDGERKCAGFRKTLDEVRATFRAEGFRVEVVDRVGLDLRAVA